MEKVRVRLLLDQHLSGKLVKPLQEAFPGTSHVSAAGLTNSPDDALWEHARTYGFTILTKDEDFQVLSFARGHPPKVIWLRTGNQRSADLLELLVRARSIIDEFDRDEDRSLLVLTR
jgi:predicted nuclease of predicted toxin-antitoxin system